MDNVKNAPEPHEMDTAVRIASEGKDVLHRGQAVNEPDLEIRPFLNDGGSVEPQIWDLKFSENATSIENAFSNSFKKSIKAVEGWFISNNQPYRLIIDVSKRYSTQEVQTFLNDLLAKSEKAKIRENFNKLDELLIYTTDGPPVIYRK